MNDRPTLAEQSSAQIFSGFRIATMCRPGTTLDPHSGKEGLIVSDNPYGAIEGASIGVTGGTIDWILPDADVPTSALSSVIHGEGKWLTPGLIDCHTHLVYGGNRAKEWEARLGGTSYEEIARSGGGILSSVHATRTATEESLVESASKRLQRLMTEGVTTVEIKSGYGLDPNSELKMLRAANRLGQIYSVDVLTTLLAAHAVPPEFHGRADAYIDLVCKEIIPAAKSICSAVDVFCESIAFTVDQSLRVLQTGLDHQLMIKAHAEQLTRTGIAVEAAKMRAHSCDHLEFLSVDDCQVMAAQGTVATLLPGAFYFLKETQAPPVKALLEAGVPIAIATDANPGSSPILSLLTVGNLACTMFGLTPEQTLQGMTRHAAKALGLDDRGEIKPGNVADFAIWDIESPAELFYQIGAAPCVSVYKNGVLR